MRRVATSTVLLVLFAACSEPPTAPPEVGPTLSIEDAVHNGGNEHFFWLPPMVSNPTYSGTFDGALSPVVEICEWTGSACVTPLLAEFTTTTGPGSETIRMVPEDEHYIVNWHTDEFGLDPAKTYRIVAKVDGQELGHADVDVVSNGGQMRNVDTDEYIPLVDGRTLPVKFRIEEGALDLTGPVTNSVAADPNPVAVGVAATLTATVDDASTGSSDVVAAEYNIDGGAYTPMVASDGTFDSPVEGVEASVPTFATPGDRTICVRGTDAVGNIGADACVTLSVEGFAWAQVAAGGNHTCAVSTAGEPYCWGQGGGAIGNGSTAAQNVPTAVSGGHTASFIEAGANRSCLITTTGDAYCWGPNTEGELGIGTAGTTELSPVAVSGGLTFERISQVGRTTCGLPPSGQAYCWGNNDLGQLGDGTFTDRLVPTAVSGGLTFAELESSCGVTPAGDAYCWGQNSKSDLGIGSVGGNFPTPQAVVGGHTFTDLAASTSQRCGITDTGAVQCWSLNLTGALGFDPIDVGAATLPPVQYPTPVLAANVPTNLTSISAGDGFFCGLDASGAAVCWGLNFNGQLGVDLSTTTQACVRFGSVINACTSSAVTVGGGHTFVQLDAGGSHACGLTADGEIWCWGRGDQGQLGNGVYSPSGSTPNPVPVQVIDPA